MHCEEGFHSELMNLSPQQSHIMAGRAKLIKYAAEPTLRAVGAHAEVRAAVSRGVERVVWSADRRVWKGEGGCV